MSRPLARLGVLALSAAALTACASTPEAPAAQAHTAAVTGIVPGDISAEIQVAHAKRMDGDYAGAVRMLSQIMLVDPDNAQVIGEYGKTLVEQGRSQEAVDFLKRGIELAPADWTMYSALGIAYDQLQNFPAARTAYQRALILKPGESVVLNNFAMSRMLAGDLPEARKLIAQAAVSKDPRVEKNVDLIAELSRRAPAVSTMTEPHPAAIAKAVQPEAVAKTAAPAAVAASHAPVPLTAAPNAIAKAAEPSKAPREIAKTAEPRKAAAAPHEIAKAVEPHDAMKKTAPQEVAKAKPKADTEVATAKTTPAADQIPALRLANDGL